MSNRLLVLASATLLATTASAQFCSDNTYPIRLVDAAGNELVREFDPTINEQTYLSPTEEVYLAFDPAIPSGTYYVHITDTPIDGMDEVLSTNDPMDRFVHVENTNGVITLSFPASTNPSGINTGVGLNGIGESLCLDEYTASQYSQCNFKIWYGDNWNLTNGENNPYLLGGGLHPTTGDCSVRSYHSFKVGDGDGGDVCGTVFQDTNENGLRDPGEQGLEGWTVSLADANASIQVVTDADGNYCFENVGAGSFSVELTLQAGFTGTTATSNSLETCACADKQGGDFGVAPENTVVKCKARTIGFWRNCHGRWIVNNLNLLPLLPALCIVDHCGNPVSFANTYEYTRWLRRARAWNMAYMLSAQLVAMHNNVAAGFVTTNAIVDDPDLGMMTIEDLMAQAVASLCANPFTPPCSGAARWEQTKLKNALDRANNNQTWVNCTSHTCNSGSHSGGSYSSHGGQRNRRGRRWRR